MAHRITVIGGVNADIGGTPSESLIPADSNIGHVSLCPGGVGHNIARELSALGNEVAFITATGNDTLGAMLRSRCRLEGLDISRARLCEGLSSSVYLYILEKSGELHVGLNDMSIVAEINPEFLAQHLDFINASDACVVDANLSREALEYLCTHVTVPLYGDPVSVTKAEKFLVLLDRFAAVKPNRMEYEVLQPVPCRCYVSAGADGIYAHDGENVLHIPAQKVTLRNANGCGDAAVAAIVHGELEGFGLQETAEFAVKISGEKASRL